MRCAGNAARPVRHVLLRDDRHVERARSRAAMPGTTRRFWCTPTARCRGWRPAAWCSACSKTPPTRRPRCGLHSGDRLVLFTDGITEAGSDEDRVRRRPSGRAGGRDIERRSQRSILDAIFRDVARFCHRRGRSAMMRTHLTDGRGHAQCRCRTSSSHKRTWRSRRRTPRNAQQTSAKQNIYAAPADGIPLTVPLPQTHA